MRTVSRTLAGAVAAVAAAVAIGGTTHAQTALVNNFPGHYFAPYIDMTAFPTQSLVSDSQNGGIKFYSLAFITTDSSTTCLAAWGSAVPLSQLGTFLPNLDSDIQSVRGRGCGVMGPSGRPG